MMIIKINKNNISNIDSILKKVGNNCVLEFEKDEYDFYKEDAKDLEIHFSNTDTIKNPVKKIFFNFNKLSNLHIKGNGSRFVFHGDIATFVIQNSNKIVFEDIYIDYKIPTSVELYVEDINFNEKSIYFRIPEIYSYQIDGEDKSIIWYENSKDNSYNYWHQKDSFDAHSVTIFDLKENYSKRFVPSQGPFSNVKSIEKTKNGIKVFYLTLPIHINSNSLVVLNASRNRDNAGFAIVESSNIYFKNVEFNYLHGFGLLIQMSENIYFDSCNFKGNNRHKVSSFADSIHVSGLKGKLKINDCIFDSPLDDPINVHGTFVQIEDIQGNIAKMRYVHYQQGGFKQYFVGDKVQFFDRLNILPREEKLYTVKNIKHPGEYCDNLQFMEVEFEQILPKYLMEKINGNGRFVAENVTYTPGVEIKNCIFRNVPSRGILCTTRKKVLIENNDFLNMTMASIYISNDANEWYESGPVKDMTIKNNKFLYTDGFIKNNNTKVIWVDPISIENSNGFIHENIKIENNIFEIKKDNAIVYKNTKDISIKYNKFISNL